MNTRLILAFIALSLAPVLPAQVPQLINYQGRVAVNGTNTGRLESIRHRIGPVATKILSDQKVFVMSL